MRKDLVAPSVGESVTEVTILKWLKNSGEAVKAGEAVLEIESDKATVEVAAEIAGVVIASKPAGERVKVGEVIGAIDSDAKATVVPSQPSAARVPPAPPAPGFSPPSASMASSQAAPLQPGPATLKLAAEQGVDWARLQANGQGSGKDGRLTKGDLLSGAAAAGTPALPKATPAGARRVPMSSLRARIAERLVQAQHNAAILTTFNECDLSAVNRVRTQHKDAFKAKNGVSLGFMSFFTKACVAALRAVPSVNAQIDGHDILQFDSYDIGVAVGTDRGLVVPILRNAGGMSFVDIERGIAAMAEKAKGGKLSIADMSGGTFTISNGGTYGSLLSTPILNPPQSAILGMHKIQERPVAVDGKVEIRPMMYLALSYDHRLIDGKEAVTFLVNVKEAIEKPEKLGLDFI